VEKKMILNNLVFPIKLGAKFVEGSIPTGYLTANDINKDMVYVISPEVGATNVTLTLQNSKQSEKEVRAVMKRSSITVDMLVSKDKSYYDLIKDWNVWQCFLPSKALTFVSYNRANQIGISFGFRQATVPNMSGFNFKGNITNDSFVPVANGYYVNKTALFIYNGLELTYNDVLIKYGDELLVKKAIITSINTSTLEYDVDPSVYDSDIETIDIGIAESLILQANEMLEDIELIKLIMATKQDNLIAGENITIIDNVISATGGSSGGYEPDNITIGLNAEQKLEVKDNLEIDGGFL
jgi:hypothetical protein